MKDILVFCNTYYQLLVAIQLQLTLKQKDRVSIFLTDQSRGAEEIAKRLRKANFFHQVFFAKTKVNPKQANMAFKLRVLCDGIFGSLPADIPHDYVCHELIGFNLDLATCGVYAALYRRNPAILCNTMEEGLLSYDVPESTSGLMRTICKARRLLGKKNLRTSVRSFYCFNPQVYHGALTPVQIPRIDCRNPQLHDLLQQVFLADTQLTPFTQKYIYLPCIYDMEGGAAIGEVALAKNLATQVGEENLLAKPHPRDNADRYANAGVTVAANSPIPFEVLAILQDYSDKVLITTLSGSVLNISALLAEPPVSYYAYPLCQLEGNPLAQHFQKVIDRYLDPASGLDVTNIRLLDNLSQLSD